jgi:integrase
MRRHRSRYPDIGPMTKLQAAGATSLRAIAAGLYRHGLRVSEACDLRWDDIDLPKRTIIVRRLTGSTDSVERDEVNGLKLLHRQQQADGIKAAYVFINERSRPFGRMGIGRMIERRIHARHARGFWISHCWPAASSRA